MKIFKDTEGREWQVVIHAGTVKRVRALLDINLCDLMAEKAELLVKLHDDLLTLVDVVYVVCKPQADDRGLSDEKFAAALGGDVLELAREALLAELVDFFPRREVRESISKMIAKLRAMSDQLVEHGMAALDQFDAESAAKQLISSFGNSPASPGSIPKEKRSAN